MKNYDETINYVFERIHKYEIDKKHRRNIMIKTIIPLCCICIVTLIGIGIWKSSSDVPDNSEVIQEETTPYVFEIVSNRPDAPIIWEKEVILDSGFIIWNGKTVEIPLYEVLSDEENNDQYIAIGMSLKISNEFVYNGKTITEHEIEAEKELQFCQGVDKLLRHGDDLKYGEALINEGTPTGVKWGKEMYYETIGYIGKDLLDKYIVNGEFLREELEADYGENSDSWDGMKCRNEYDRAIDAAYIAAVDEAVKKAEQLNIYYERRSERNITIFVTADEFSTLNIGDVTMYGLASEFEEEGKGMDL